MTLSIYDYMDIEDHLQEIWRKRYNKTAWSYADKQELLYLIKKFSSWMIEIGDDYDGKVVCPYCGHEHDNPVYDVGDYLPSCDECGEAFHFDMKVITLYSTKELVDTVSE